MSFLIKRRGIFGAMSVGLLFSVCHGYIQGDSLYTFNPILLLATLFQFLYMYLEKKADKGA
jgi:hypothetical protein